MSRSFEYIDDQGNTVSAKTEWFIGRALSDVIGLNKKNKLIVCVEHELEELWLSDYACFVLARLIKHEFDKVEKNDYSKQILIAKIKQGELKQRGWSFEKTNADAKRNPILWQRVHYWKGKGSRFGTRQNPMKLPVQKQPKGMH